MLNTQDILETLRMIREEHLDIRTVTMGISLFDCISDDPSRLEQKIYDKITSSAKGMFGQIASLEMLINSVFSLIKYFHKYII